MKERIIESSKIKVKLLNESTIDIRPLTLAERKECLTLLPKDFSGKDKDFVDKYMKVQGDLIFYIINISNKKFKREDVDTQLDSSLMEEIIRFTLKDPFSELFGI